VDAVIVGSKTVAEEGCDVFEETASAPNVSSEITLSASVTNLESEQTKEVSSTTKVVVKNGYIWQAYSPCSWPHITDQDPILLQKIQKQRTMLQQNGWISNRRYPAQILITSSGKSLSSTKDFLQASVLSTKHPDGSDFEVYIITSINGAIQIRQRAHKFPYLQDRLDQMLIVLPDETLKHSDKPDDYNESVDLKILPSLLFERYNMKIINHDGGRELLKKWLVASILSCIDSAVL
jgi:hypothetical protein